MNKKRFLFLLIFLLAALGAGFYVYFRPQITSWIERVISERGDQTPPGEEPACEEQTYTNTRQGYEVCYPMGWSNRAFGYSQLSVGFDAFPLPEASEYGGVFHIAVSRQNSATLLAQYLSGLGSPETSTGTVDGVSGIRVQGTFSSDDNFFPNYYQIAVVVERFSRTYSIVLLSSPDGYAANLPLFEQFLSSFNFLEGTSAPPWGRDIYLDTPWPGDMVSGSFRIAGSAQGAFENTIVAQLKTDAGEVLFQEPIIYNAAEIGELGYFDVPVTFTTVSESGTLEVYHTSAKDGSIVDLVSIPLKFK